MATGRQVRERLVTSKAPVRDNDRIKSDKPVAAGITGDVMELGGESGLTVNFGCGDL